MAQQRDGACGPGVLLFTMPFAAPASYKHAEKLIDCLAAVCGHLVVVGDGRLSLGGQPAHVVRQGRLPTLHYLGSVRPALWSALLWALKLIWIVLRGAAAVVATRDRIDVVVCFQGAYYTPILLCARLLGKRTVALLPNSDAALAAMTYQGRPGAKLLVGVLARLQRANCRLADLCALESLRLAGQLGLSRFAAKLRVANLYVDTARYAVQVPLACRAPVVGYIGRLSAGKGVPALLDAAAQLRGSGIQFQIIGDGPLRASVEHALERPELGHVTLAGWADAVAIVQSLNRFRLLVLPTESEGLPNVLLEAQACGTPVLATLVGAIPDVIEHERTGFALEDRAPGALAGAIGAALAHPRLELIAEGGRAHVSAHYSLAASAEKWRAVLAELGGPDHREQAR